MSNNATDRWFYDGQIQLEAIRLLEIDNLVSVF